MASVADDLSSPGTVSYDSDTMSVGDGTWDFSKNSFLLPNLQGLNFETMRYNGMANRFSTWSEYRRLVVAHAVLAAIVFLFIVPFAIFGTRFFRSASRGRKWHNQLLIFGSLLLLASFMLGFFAVGPKRSLTNPHHGIGVALFVMYACYILGDRLVENIKTERSVRRYIHMWGGRFLTLLGIIQVPLGLTLYGASKMWFIAYSIHTAFMLAAYFVLDYKSYWSTHHEFVVNGSDSNVLDSRKDKNHKKKWLAPIAALAGVFMINNLRKDKSHDSSDRRSRSQSKSRSSGRDHSRPYSPSYGGTSRYDSGSHVYYNEKPEKEKKTGFFGKLLAAGAAIGGAKAASSWVGKKDDRRRYDEEYSVVSTENSHHNPPPRHPQDTESYFTEDYDSRVGPSNVTASRNTIYTDSRVTAAEDTTYRGASVIDSPPRRHRSPSRSAARSRLDYGEDDDGYESPSHRLAKKVSKENATRGLFGGLGMGWLASKWRGSKKEEEESLRRDEEAFRSGVSGSRFTGDSSGSPRDNPRRLSHRTPTCTATTMSSYLSEDESSGMYSRYGSSMPPASTLPPSATQSSMPMSNIDSYTASSMPPNASRSDHRRARSASRPRERHVESDLSERRDSMTSLPSNTRYTRRTSSSRRRANDAAAVAAVASASVLAREQAERVSKIGRTSQPPHRRSDDEDGSSVIETMPARSGARVKMTVDGDKERVTLRRLTEEEAAAARRDRHRRDSLSSLSGNETPTGGRYRRDSGRGSFGNDPQGSQSRRPGTGDNDPPYPVGPQSPGGMGLIPTDSQDSFMNPSANESLAENNRRRRRMERRFTVTSQDQVD
ncbi:hypothetical protein Cpir12675_003199 [Ceratocystis pirilliformis]|uniref:Cytochrome b561 domain-containing protein n=1 Tax=Ceratocystis pirilliformis TaxID=259994 RepID=A0ABR3Z652_9PEZI